MKNHFKNTIKLINATENEEELTALYKLITFQVIMKEQFSKEEVRNLQQVVKEKYETFGITI